MTENHERRSFSRIAFDSRITLKQGDKQWSATLTDLSLKGLLIEQPADWSADVKQLIEAQIYLGEEITITMNVNWRHNNNGQIGFECEHIDIESIIHLRRLVELNLGDEALLERELASLGN
jgi:hypothetical protein